MVYGRLFALAMFGQVVARVMIPVLVLVILHGFPLQDIFRPVATNYFYQAFINLNWQWLQMVETKAPLDKKYFLRIPYTERLAPHRAFYAPKDMGQIIFIPENFLAVT